MLKVGNSYRTNLVYLGYFYIRYLSNCLFVGCTRSGHIVIYAPGDSLPGRRAAN
ncbi:hypothetical protein [Photorhabdus australis]|uniref:hypothetical protein n=1 Tax=Photorhabdus australis TaxID=286156 RepID=UPI0030D7C49A